MPGKAIRQHRKDAKAAANSVAVITKESAAAATKFENDSLPVAEIIDLICPIAVLAISNSGFQPDPSEILWKTQGHIDGGSYGRISVGPILKDQLHPSLTTKSGRISRYDGEMELVTFKSPHDINGWSAKTTHLAPGQINQLDFIPFKDTLPELAFLSAPDLLYHENIVDLLGYFWEPYGGLTSVVHAPTLILEFADQGSLRTFLSSTKLLISAKLSLCIDICRALQTLHHELELYGEPFGLYHGDLKPDNILVFSKPSTSGWAAVLRHLGSCVRYDPKLPSQRNDLALGTQGWKAPELIEAGEPRIGESPEVPVDPVKAEVFAFGLLLAYMILEKEPFRLPSVARFLADNYFGRVDTSLSFRNPTDITTMSGRENLPKLYAAQQWMICHHLDTLVDCLQQSINKLQLPVESAEAIIGVLNLTLCQCPNERVASFRDICNILGGDPDECRKRIPIEPIINTFAAKDIHMTIQGAINSIALTASMPYSFHMWLGEHLERVFDHTSGSATKEHKGIAGHVALMRGLLSFIPPEVARKSEEGLKWLRNAVDFGCPQAATIYVRLAASQDSFTLEQSLTTQLQEEAKSGSLLPREDLLEHGFSIETMPEPDLSKVIDAIVQNFETCLIWPLHNIVFMRDENEIQVVIDKAVKERWDIEAQSLVGADMVTAGRLNYAMSQPGTALHWAVAMNNLPAIKALIGTGASPYTKNLGGNTPWSLAVGSRLLSVIQLFAEFCLCDNERDRAESTKQGIYNNSLHVYLACGRHFVQRSLGIFQYLWKIKALTRKDAYESTVSIGPASPDLLEHLFEVDYPLDPDANILLGILLHAIQFSDRTSVRIILKSLPRFKTANYTVFVLCAAIKTTQAASFEIFLQLLDHLSPDFDVNIRFTYLYETETKEPTISTTTGVTLLHFAFSRGKTTMAIELLKRGADPSIVSLDPNSEMSGMTPLGHLLFSQTHHNYLALSDFLTSQYLKEHPKFMLDNAILNPDRRQNIFHLISSGEDERVHNSAGHKVSALYELIGHFGSIPEKQAPRAREKVVELVNARMMDNDEEGMTPLLLAATSGFSQAIPLLTKAGANVLERIGKCEITGHPGITPLHAADTRSELVWQEEFQHKYWILRKGGIPWIEMDSPVAKKLMSDYEERTWECVQQLRDILVQSPEGRTFWEMRKAAREADGLRVE